MPIVAGDLKLYQATTMPTSLTAPTSIGGAISANQITGGAVGEALFTMPAGGSPQTQYTKVFFKNTHGTDTLSNAKIYIANACIAGDSGNYTHSLQSTSASDTGTCRVIGEDSGGSPASETITMTGTTLAAGATTFSTHAAHVLSTPAVGTITIRRNGNVIGYIPPGRSSAVSEIDFGVEGSLNDSTTTTDASTAPSGISFSRPSTYATGVAVFGDDLAPGDRQGIWLRWIQQENRPTTTDVEIALEIAGDI